MKALIFFLFIFFLFIFFHALHTLHAQAAKPPTQQQMATLDSMHLYVWDRQSLDALRQKAQEADAKTLSMIADLKKQGNSRLKDEPYFVTMKEITPPSGDKHDYMSMAPYWWPNPQSKDGLPYIRKDGQRNPETQKLQDAINLDRMTRVVQTLTLAWWFTGEEKYAQHAATLLRSWFLDSKTQMNPNLNFAQGIPGKKEMTSSGVIEGRSLIRVVDTVGMLESAKALSTKEVGDIKKWFSQFLTWLQTSEQGKKEAAAPNNHGTWYDAQLAAYALFTDQNQLAKSTIDSCLEKRLAVQILPDGSQPRELGRTQPLNYSAFNLRAFSVLAALGTKVGVDLFAYKSTDGRSLSAAVKWVQKNINTGSSHLEKELAQKGVDKAKKDLEAVLNIQGRKERTQKIGKVQALPLMEESVSPLLRDSSSSPPKESPNDLMLSIGAL